MDNDELAAMLAAIRENAEGLTASHDDEDCRPGHACTGHEAIWMADALDAVLKRHYRVRATGSCVICAEPYPCNEVQDVTAALLGEGDAAADPPRPEPFRRPEGCICRMFGDTGGVRIADLTCPVHGVGGTDPGDGNWEANTGG